MLRYKLDDLGAFQFEWLIQSLLKKILGPGVESWGGRGDYGVDSFSAGPLNFPDRSVSSSGPFIFQVKFVENANAASSDPLPSLKQSVLKEKARILERIKQRVWRSPAHYVLVSNAVFPPQFRNWAQDALSQVIDPEGLHLLSGSDVCDFLDHEPSIRQSFPQILSLRDLADLIQSAVAREEIERSRSAIDCAAEIAPVFVPTRAYYKAWRVLSEHHFAVLEGPPEMGKSAIAWMIALAQVANGWQGIYCAGPEVFFSQYDKNRPQVFVADDAFGLTEYDPSRSQKWEKELGLVLSKLDNRHWLIWTSRKHILERALQKLDFRREVSHFPEPSAVAVSADDLTRIEKALILYRHSKAAHLASAARRLIQKSAKKIIGDVNFTPERIRKVAKDLLPKCGNAGALSDKDIELLEQEIRETIANPTVRVTTTFRALPVCHKWALFAMLEGERAPNLQQVSRGYLRLCPADDQEPFSDVVEQLTEAFIKRQTSTLIFNREGEPVQSTTLSWIHPSYRDLVIDELTREVSFSNRFLSTTGLSGLKLAISGGGGEHGERKLPLLTSPRAWKLLVERCKALAETDQVEILPELLQALTAASLEAGSETKPVLEEAIRAVSDIARRRWSESETVLRFDELEAYRIASLALSPLPPSPTLDKSWEVTSNRFLEEIRSSKRTNYFFPDEVEEFIKLTAAIKNAEPRFLFQKGFPEQYRNNFEEVIELAVLAAAQGVHGDDADAVRTEGYRFERLASVVESILELFPDLQAERETLTESLKERAQEAESEASQLEPPEPEYEEEREFDAERDFDVDALFADV